MQSLAGKVAIVTGASRGIGEAAALALGEAGAAVMLAARSGEQAEANAQQITAAGGKAAALECDVSDYDACQRLVHETARRFGPPDVLVNNAGVIEPISMVATGDPQRMGAQHRDQPDRRVLRDPRRAAWHAGTRRTATSSTCRPARRCGRWKAGAPIAPARRGWRC